MSSRVFESLIMLVVAGIFTSISGFAVSYFTDYKSVVTIGESTQVAKDQFILPVNLSAFDDLNNLRLSIPGSLTEKQIKSNKPINIKVVTSNLGTTNGTVFEIKKLPLDSNTELVLLTNKQLNDKEIIVYGNGNKVNVKYANEMENPIKAQVKTIITNAVMYAILLGGIYYLANRRQDKKIKAFEEERDEKIKEVRENHEDIQKLMDFREETLNKAMEDNKISMEKLGAKFGESEKTLEKLKIDSKKSQILLLAKLNDYRKELNFWRDTIRKIIYQLPNGDSKAEQLIKIVSKSLKTYQTHEKQEHDFEALKVLSKMIRDMEQDDRG
ncbi:hypothetical protein J7J00_24790 [Bacillus sp. ISL-4]|uniref:hypothetical protein n=1 Tax=Bacillus sp. ISL-4 TaxID=2819125 RepID=UPI001BEB086F|nr:hypothetical protein [Bacillus sp. ISL-4]MBT2668651.1 hypothetical protein [Bacillus sp. ISL-4]MBT2673375.1 hypothetical protein [Streptomyces sp. ISL-14]